MSASAIPFSRPYVTSREREYVDLALRSGHLHGDGPMTAEATRLLTAIAGAAHAHLTPSCTHALEMAALLLDLGQGDEVIVPSFTFSSTAAAVALRGAVPVFADVEPTTLNIDPASVQACLTPRTRAIFVVHYGGVAADVDRIGKIAEGHGLEVVEDNAHGLGATWRGQPLGTFGALATQSFHATKNVQCGEGGAILVNRNEYLERAEIIREKGTDRSRFLRGQVDKYTWNDIGSSFLPSELQAAVLRSQLESFEEIQGLRHRIWATYAESLVGWALSQGVRLMNIPDDAEHPAHLFYLLMPSHELQQALLAHLRACGITATFHYVPLDSSPAGRRFGRTPNPCTVSHDISSRLVRLPLFAGMNDTDVERVVEAVRAFGGTAPSRVG